MTRRLDIDILSRAGSVARGYGARDLLEQMGVRPVWSALSHGYGVQTHRVSDLIALAERRGYDITIKGQVFSTEQVIPDVSPDAHASPRAAAPEPARLW